MLAAAEGAFDTDLLDQHTKLYRLVGALTGEDDLARFRLDLEQPPDPAFYDWENRQLIVSGAGTELSPRQRAVVVHEIAHALTDQLFSAGELRETRRAESADDRFNAANSLVEGDGTYFELLYIQGLPLEEQQEIALAVAADQRGEGMPQVVLDEFLFPFQEGMDFVAALVRSGGIAAVDRAYLQAPEGSSTVMHPEQQLRGELPLEVPEIEVELEGFSARPPASLGEFGLRQVLSQARPPGLLTQTVDGWAGDTYRLYENADGEIVFAYRIVLRSEADAIEVTEAFIDMAEQQLEAGEPLAAGGGILYRGNGYYIFMDRVVDELTLIIATNADAGAAVRDEIAPPAE